MKLYIIRDGSFTLNKGKAASNLLHYKAFGRRYTNVFDEVVITGRLFNTEDETALPVEGQGVHFDPLPGRRGIFGALVSLLSTLLHAWKATNSGSAYLLRVPGTIPTIYYVLLKLKRIPFSVEVAADPYDSYSPQSLNGHKLAKWVQKFFVKATLSQCADSSTSLYVTKNALQLRYPPAKSTQSYSCTSIDLPANNFRKTPKTYSLSKNKPFKIILVGNMESKMKGHDVLLSSLSILKQSNYLVTLDVIGYGKYKNYFKKLAEDLNIGDSVHFLGKIQSGKEIFRYLEQSDIFVLPSRQEGLPRALIEAMSQALPAIATRVGGTNELLDNDWIVDPESPKQIADKIIDLIYNEDLCNKLSARNLELAKEYSSDNISKTRNNFLLNLKECSEAP